MGPKGREVPSSVWFWDRRVDGQLTCQPVDLLNMSVNHGSLQNGTHVTFVLEVVVEWPVTQEWDPKLETIRAFELACMRIRSCINEGYSRGFRGVTGGRGSRGSGQSPEGSEGARNEVSRQRVSFGLNLTVARKECCPIPSQLRILVGGHGILVQLYNSGPQMT